MRDIHKAIACCVAVSCATTFTQADAISLGFGGGVSYTSTHEMTGLNIYEIGGPSEGFVFDPNAGGWEKQLLAPSNGFVPGEIYCISEWFTFCAPPAGGPNYPLEDWHEVISFGPDGNIWDVWVTDMGPPVISFDPDSGEPIPGLEFMISTDGTGLWFDFDPILPGPNGVTLHINKYFRYTGSTVSFDPVIITQYPTPAPSSLALLGVAGLMTCRRRR